MTAVLDEVSTESTVETTEWVTDIVDNTTKYKPGVNVDRMRAELAWIEEQDKLPFTRREWNQSMYYSPKSQRVMCCDDCRQMVQESDAHAQMCFVGHIAFTDLGADHPMLTSPSSMLDHAQRVLGVSQNTVRSIATSGTVSNIRRLLEDAAGAPL